MSAGSVALIYQPMMAAPRQLAERCGQIAASSGFQPRLLSAWELGDGVDRSGVCMAVTFGGDGTIIRAARWLAGSGTPILGVAMGKLGFMTELPPASACETLPSVLAGNYWRDERLMISATVHPPFDPDSGPADLARHGVMAPLIALNDVVVTRGASPRVVQIDVEIDGAPLARYVADGLVLATPTGSTAYALAAGGPVMAPGVEGLLMVPIAAHLALLRSLVVPLSARIDVRAFSDQATLLVVDGQVQIHLSSNQLITVELARERTVFARIGSTTRFYETVMESLKKR